MSKPIQIPQNETLYSDHAAITLAMSVLVGVATFAAIFGFEYVTQVWWHSLGAIPGPKIAAITSLYEFYWDVIKPGKLTWHLQDLHDKYGPIVRIGPDEVHIRDPAFFDALYARSTGKRDKLPRFSGRFGFKSDCFSTWQHDLHRMRRAAINPFFSVQKVTNLQPVIRSNLNKLTKTLVKAAESGETVPINLAYMALTADITTTYAFARSYNQLDSPGFQTTYDATLKSLYTLGNVTVHFPIIFQVIDNCPPWLTSILNPVVMPIINFYADCEKQISEIRTGTNRGHELAENPTIFHEMLRSNNLPDDEKTDKRLGEEAVEIVAAGIVTVSFALTVGTYHISTNAQVRTALQTELLQRLPEPLNLSNLDSNKKTIDWHTLESFPYLSACIRESIRLSGGIATRAPRIAPDEPIQYQNYTIPAGYAVSMTAWHVAHDPEIFPDPDVFRPERWLRSDGSRNMDMDRWIVAFGKGPRQCVGINLAYAEMYIALATLFRSFEFTVSGETTWEKDVRVSHAYMIPYPDMKSKGVKVYVKLNDE